MQARVTEKRVAFAFQSGPAALTLNRTIRRIEMTFAASNIPRSVNDVKDNPNVNQYRSHPSTSRSMRRGKRKRCSFNLSYPTCESENKVGFDFGGHKDLELESLILRPAVEVLHRALVALLALEQRSLVVRYILPVGFADSGSYGRKPLLSLV
jgi:hypothetical protein